MQLCVVVPFHRNLGQLSQCLAAVRAARPHLPEGTSLRETIVVADGALDDPNQAAAANGASVLVIDGPRGPAVARNRGAAGCSAEVLVFIDSDVVISSQALSRIAGRLATDPALGAVFGAYDEDPADAGFFSQGRNLAHSFIHQRSAGEARTFWAGLGAVRADLFERVGGFDERFTKPSVEDIDLGYRIRAAGGRILLDPQIQGRHLRRWTLLGSIATDIKDRGVPWTQLLHRYGGLHDDLNVTLSYRACVVLAYMLVLCLVLTAWRPILIVGVPLAALSLWWLDRPYYRFFASRRGIGYAVRWFPIHVLHHLCNGFSFAVGTMLHACKRWTGVSLPWTLPLTTWAPEKPRLVRPSP